MPLHCATASGARPNGGMSAILTGMTTSVGGCFYDIG
jgi:hypothetical protein